MSAAMLVLGLSTGGHARLSTREVASGIRLPEPAPEAGDGRLGHTSGGRGRFMMNAAKFSKNNGPETPNRRAGQRIVRRLAAVLAWDISGYSALMDTNEEDTHRRVGEEIARVMREIDRAAGRVFTFAGDGLIAEFPSAVEAVRCALRIQADSGRRSARLPANEQIRYRMGINSGEIMIQGGRTGGNAVNIAARLEQTAEPGSICLSQAVWDQVNQVIPVEYVWLGQRRLKNIRDPIVLYAITTPNSASSPATPDHSNPKPADTDAEYRPSLAVLPFRTLQQDQADAYFAEGMVDDIVRVLGGLKYLIVVSRSATLGYNQASPNLEKISQELNVSYVLRGSIRRSGQQLRIAVELLDARTRQSLIWADRFDGNIEDIFDLQDRIALRTASSIAPYVREQELRRASHKDRNTMTAYDLTLQALDQLYARDRTALARAEELLKRAIALDSHYPTAYTHLGYLNLFRIGQGWSLDEHADRLAARESARLAVERDRNDALALAIYGHLHGFLEKDHEEAMRILEQAIALGPSCALAWSFSSYVSGWMGDPEAALARARQGLRLSPIGPDAACWHEHALSQAHYMADEYEDAIKWGRIAGSHGRQSSNLRCLAASLVAAGQMDEARAVANEIMDVNPNFRLNAYRSNTPLRGPIAEVFIDRLRRAGIPE
jgi:adenylate cyclase